jgi:tetratricopeptide (TPR) repeat protein
MDVKRWAVPGIPAAVSLGLSLATVGGSVGWQDSGFFLCAVKEMALLHPPGFVLYLLLCRAWTLLFFFLDFTLAVHLFSAACAAAAAGALALAARDFSRSDAAGAAVGCLAASGYTFWASSILAKSYALFYLVVALLLWRMVRADLSREKRDFRIVAALIGLAWAAHPSAALAGPALLLFVGVHARQLGAKAIARSAGIAAACALGPSLLLPVLSTRFHDLSGGALRFLRGAPLTDVPDAFGFAPTRAESLALFTWEELLGVGTLAALAGLALLNQKDRRRLLAVAAWCIPIAAVSTSFRLQGQLDFWLVPAWMALHLAGAVALSRLPRAAIAGAAAVGVLWSVAANHTDLSQRGNGLPSAFGRVFLQNLDRDATLVLASDDVLAIVSYLQLVRGERPDVKVERESRGTEASARPPGTYFENPPAGIPFVPAGALWRSGSGFDLRAREFPVSAEDVAARPRRARGQRVERSRRGIEVEPEPHERRLVDALLRARRSLALRRLDEGTADGLGRGIDLLDSVLKVDPDSGRHLEIVLPLAKACAALGRDARAEALFRHVLFLGAPARDEAVASFHLARLLEAQGRAADAEKHRARALELLRTEPALRAELEAFRPIR